MAHQPAPCEQEMVHQLCSGCRGAYMLHGELAVLSVLMPTALFLHADTAGAVAELLEGPVEN